MITKGNKLPTELRNIIMEFHDEHDLVFHKFVIHQILNMWRERVTMYIPFDPTERKLLRQLDAAHHDRWCGRFDGYRACRLRWVTSWSEGYFPYYRWC